MILFTLLPGDRQEAALLVLGALVLFVFLPLVIIGFIIYRVVVEHMRNGWRRRNYIGPESNNAGGNRNAPNKLLNAGGVKSRMKDKGGGMK